MNQTDIRALFVREWHIVIGGFQQDLGTYSGMRHVWRGLHRFAGDEIAVVFYPWRADWKQLAELISQMRPADGKPVVKIYAYSWGCGHGFTKLAAELGKRNIDVAAAVLSDPVFYSSFLSTRFLAFAPNWPIRVPETVRHVEVFRQNFELLRGHRLAWNPETTTVVEHVPPAHISHTEMDDLQAFWDRCQEIAKE
jgi:hypothetical protein